MHNRNHKETIRIIRQSRKRIIPRQKSAQQGKKPARFLQLCMRHARRVAIHVSNCEEEDGEVDEEEEGEEGEGGAYC